MGLMASSCGILPDRVRYQKYVKRKIPKDITLADIRLTHHAIFDKAYRFPCYGLWNICGGHCRLVSEGEALDGKGDGFWI